MARGGRAGGRSGGGFRGGSFRSGGYHSSHHGADSEQGCIIRLIVWVVCLLFVLITHISNRTPTIHYSDEALERYASAQYEQVFADSETYEDHLLLTFAVWPDRSDYSYITWGGDHISDATFELLGGNDSLLGRTLESEVAYGYGSTLSGNLERALELLADGIMEVSPEGSFTCTEDRTASKSYLINDSDMSLHESRLNNALVDFTDATGIPIVLVVVEAADIFN